ncbi:MAG: DMT family transporter, partial [Hyphomicrobiales bacterium]
MEKTNHTDNTKLAVIVIIFTVLALSLGDALIKSFSANLVLWQIFVLRSALALPVLLAVWRMKFAAVPLLPTTPGW